MDRDYLYCRECSVNVERYLSGEYKHLNFCSVCWIVNFDPESILHKNNCKNFSKCPYHQDEPINKSGGC